MNGPAAYALLAHGLIFGALLSLLPIGMLRPRAGLAGTAIALLAGLAPIMHATFGAPSITLLALALLRLIPNPVALLGLRAAGLVVASGLLLYPAAAGWIGPDPYALGYHPWVVAGALLPLGVVLWWLGQSLWLLILAGGLATYAGGLFDNAWDALFDPLLLLAAVFVLVRHASGRLRAAWRAHRKAAA